MMNERQLAFNSSFRTCLYPSSSAPEEIDGHAGGEQGEADGAVGGVLVDSRRDDECAGGDEERGREGMAGHFEADARVGAFVALREVAGGTALGNVGAALVRVFKTRARASAEDEERGGGEAEPDEVNRDDVVEYLLVSPRDGDDGGEQALERDCRDGRARARARRGRGGAPGGARAPPPARRHLPEEESVLGHREVDARRGQHALA